MYERIKSEIKQEYYAQNYENDGQRFVAWSGISIFDMNETRFDVTDGPDDKQIDAIHIDEDNSTIYIVQGKFIGASTVDAEPLREVLSSWAQLKNLVRLQENCNSRLQRKLAEVASALEDDYEVVFELITTASLTPSAKKDLAAFQEQIASSDDFMASIHLIAEKSRGLS